MVIVMGIASLIILILGLAGALFDHSLADLIMGLGGAAGLWGVSRVIELLERLNARN